MSISELLFEKKAEVLLCCGSVLDDLGRFGVHQRCVAFRDDYLSCHSH